MDDRTAQNNHELTADPPAPANRTLFFDVYSPAALAVPVVKSPTRYSSSPLIRVPLEAALLTDATTPRLKSPTLQMPWIYCVSRFLESATS